MRKVLLACVISASLFLPSPVIAAGGAVTFTADLQIVIGGGQLDNTMNFGVGALTLVADTASNHIFKQIGSLVLNGVATDGIIDSVLPDCSEATLLCEDVTHQVVAAVESVSRGSLDGSTVVTGAIYLVCKHWPATSR